MHETSVKFYCLFAGLTRKAATVASIRARLSSMEPAPLEKSVFKRLMLSTTISEADSTVVDDRSSLRESVSQPTSNIYVLSNKI